MAEFKPSTWAQPVQDIVKEYEAHDAAEHYEEVLTKPEEFSKSLVRRGVIDPNTGFPTGNSKQKHLSGWVPSRAFQGNYERTFGHR